MQNFFPFLSLHSQSCSKGTDWEEIKGVCSIKELLCGEHKQPAELPKISQACEPRLAAKYVKVEDQQFPSQAENRVPNSSL